MRQGRFRCCVAAVVLLAVVGVSGRALGGRFCAAPGALRALLAVDLVTAAAKEKVEDSYYYTTSGCDGALSIEIMTDKQALDLRKEQKEQYDAEGKKWNELKTQWQKAFGSKAFPLSPPKPPKAAKGQKLSTNEKARDKSMQRYTEEIEVFDVCLVTNAKGVHSAASIRHDKMYGRLQELQKEYVEAAILYAEQHKADTAPKKDDKDAPVKPEITTVKDRVKSDVADKLLERLVEKLKKDEEKQAEKDAEKKVEPVQNK